MSTVLATQLKTLGPHTLTMRNVDCKTNCVNLGSYYNSDDHWSYEPGRVWSAFPYSDKYWVNQLIIYKG